MAAAGAILVRTLRLLEGKVREGVTTADLDAAAEKFIRSQGATPAFKGYRGFPGSICAVGPVAPVAGKLMDTTQASLFDAVEQCRAGNRVGDVSHAVQARVEAD